MHKFPKPIYPDSMSFAYVAGALWARSRRVHTAKKKLTLKGCLVTRILFCLQQHRSGFRHDLD